MLGRRPFLERTAAIPSTALAGRPRGLGKSQRKKLAIIASRWTPFSPAQQVGDRFLIGYPRDHRWHHPEMDLAALYVEHRPEGDQSRDRAAEFGFQIYPSIAETLRCGSSRLEVDGVLILAGQGGDPRSEPSDTNFFQPMAEVFEKNGRAVPVYIDQPLTFEQAREMVEVSRQLKFPVLAGSSLPLTWRLPPLELPMGCVVEQALMVGVGPLRSDRYRALEAMQCMLERRRGGETGVRSVQRVEGEAVWKAGDSGGWSKELLEAALARSDSLQGPTSVDGRPRDLANNGELPRLVKHPEAYLVDYSDGLRGTLLMLNGGVRDFTFAARLGGVPRVQSTQFFLPPKPNLAGSTCLVAQVEDMIQSGQTPVPPERALVVSGILDRCPESKVKGQVQRDTPALNLSYQPSRESSFCGAWKGTC